jgi:Zinc knuckle
MANGMESHHDTALYVKGKVTKQSVTCSQCGKQGHMRRDCPDMMHDHLVSSNSLRTSSDEEQKRKEKVDRQQRKKKEKEKLVQEAFACYATSDD